MNTETPPPYEWMGENRSSSSVFFEKTNPHLLDQLYGNNQELYKQFSSFATAKIVKRLANAYETKGGSHFLKNHLEAIGSWRREIAQEMGSQGFQNFGVLRNSPSKTNEDYYLTWLSGPFYITAAQKWLDSTLHFLNYTLPETSLTLNEMMSKIVPGALYTKKGSIGKGTTTLLMQMRTNEEIENMREALSFDPTNPFSPLTLFFSDMAEDGTLLPFNMKNWFFLVRSIEYLEIHKPPKESTIPLFLQGELYFEVENKRVLLSQYLLRIDLNPETSHVEEIIPPILMHQDLALITSTLEIIDEKIDTLLHLHPLTPTREIIDQIGEIRYLFAHTAPFSRGSAAVGEWLETALYHYLGFEQFRQTEETTIDLEAFSSLSIEEFIDRYRTILSKMNLTRIFHHAS